MSRLRMLHGAPNRRAFLRACLRQLRPPAPDGISDRNVDATYDWICRAQDATGDRGVAGHYSLVEGWSASYPETTGYLITTLLAYSKIRNSLEAAHRAIQMADWEVEVQLPSGAVRSGYLSKEPAPAVFNTGQVLFGWIAAYQETRSEEYATATRRAAQWLADAQDDDGAWRKHLSVMIDAPVQTYNARAAWGLALAGHVFEEPGWVSAARRNCDWVLSQQNSVGWFENCSFRKGTPPLLHTIAYTLEALLGVGVLLGEERYVRAALAGTRPLAERVAVNPRLPGLLGSGWEAASSWSCVVGNAQTAIVFYRLGKILTECASYPALGRTLLNGISRLQDVDGHHAETRGAIAGSDPIWGAYMKLAYPNWAAKFFLDALLLALHDGAEAPIG